MGGQHSKGVCITRQQLGACCSVAVLRGISKMRCPVRQIPLLGRLLGRRTGRHTPRLDGALLCLVDDMQSCLTVVAVTRFGLPCCTCQKSFPTGRSSQSQPAQTRGCGLLSASSEKKCPSNMTKVMTTLHRLRMLPNPTNLGKSCQCY